MSSYNPLVCAELSYDRLNVWRGDVHFSHEQERAYSSHSIDNTEHAQNIDALPDAVRAMKAYWAATHTAAPIHIDYMSVSLQDVLSLQTHAATEIRHSIVAAYEIDEVCRNGRQIGLPEGYNLYHVEPLWYHVDQYVRVRDPIGMHGKRLEGHFHLVAAHKRPLEHITSVFKKAGITIGQYVLQPMILPYAAWGKKDYQGQKIMISLQGERCHIAVLEKNVCRFVASHIMGESLMDRDLSTCLGVSMDEAEKIRRSIPGMLEHKGFRRGNGLDIPLIVQILQARSLEMVQEIYQMVSEHVKWDMPIRIEVQSQAIAYYWNASLQHVFPQAEIYFWEHEDDGNSMSWSCEALMHYVASIHSKKNHTVTGWRHWWKMCQNWVEYHL